MTSRELTRLERVTHSSDSAIVKSRSGSVDAVALPIRTLYTSHDQSRWKFADPTEKGVDVSSPSGSSQSADHSLPLGPLLFSRSNIFLFSSFLFPL